MINDLKEIRERLNAIIEAQEKPEVKEPDLMWGYAILCNGEVENIFNGDRLFVQNTYNQGNWFPTRKEAEAEARKRAIRQKMRSFIKTPVSEDWWPKTEKLKFGIFKDGDNTLAIDWYYRSVSPTLVAFGSKEDAQACLDAMRDEIEELFV